jgi:hypothetical protein
MFKRFWKRFLPATLAILWLTGCAIAPVIPPRGIIFNDQQAPMFSGNATGSKEGRSSTYTILFLVGWGDASIDTAAKEGKITQIRQLDYELFNVFGIYQCFTTVVRGE